MRQTRLCWNCMWDRDNCTIWCRKGYNLNYSNGHKRYIKRIDWEENKNATRCLVVCKDCPDYDDEP